MVTFDEIPPQDTNRSDTIAPENSASGGWRSVYARQGVSTTFFTDSGGDGGNSQTNLTRYMKEKPCPFCSWTGPANKLHHHLPGCSGSDRGEALADGGRQLPREGERRVDKGTLGTANDDVLVVDVFPDTRADEHHVEAIGATVADVNDAYAPEAPVVGAVYISALEKAGIAERSLDDVRHAVELGEIDAYHFPAPRLAAGEPQEVNE